jgi:hypothetical protein
VLLLHQLLLLLLVTPVATTVLLACSMFQFLSFYQREMALFTAHNLDRKAADFCLDSELTPLFKVCAAP